MYSDRPQTTRPPEVAAYAGRDPHPIELRSVDSASPLNVSSIDRPEPGIVVMVLMFVDPGSVRLGMFLADPAGSSWVVQQAELVGGPEETPLVRLVLRDMKRAR